MFWHDIKDIKEWMTTISCRLTNLEMKYDGVLQEQEALDAKLFKSLDKAEDCLKNVDKLNEMINELKGCVSLARSAIAERKELAEREAKTAVLADMTKEIHRAMLAFIQAGDKLESKCHFKLDAIYKAFCEPEEKKPPKKRKPVKKKKVASVAALSE